MPLELGSILSRVVNLLVSGVICSMFSVCKHHASSTRVQVMTVILHLCLGVPANSLKQHVLPQTFTSEI